METWWYALKLLITGASGLYGSKLAKLALSKGFEVYSTDIQSQLVFGKFIKLDITDKLRVDKVFTEVKPDVVVHAASLTDVDKCELNKDLAWKINVDGTKNIVASTENTNSFLIYISTDYVFSGKKGNYLESDKPDPINSYGQTKLQAETVVQSTKKSGFLISLPSVIYGSTPAAGKVNFALWLIQKLKQGEHIKIVTDQWNTPTLNTNLAEMTLEAVERHITGIFHLSGSTRVNRYEFAVQIAETFGLNKELINKTGSSTFNWSALRPADSSLDTSAAQLKFKNKPLSLAKALEKLKKELSLNETQ